MLEMVKKCGERKDRTNCKGEYESVINFILSKFNVALSVLTL